MLERNRWSSVQRDVLRLAGVAQDFDHRRDVDEERSRPQESKGRQEFHAGIRSARHTRFAVHRPRELTHDAQVYRAYLRDAERLREDGALIRRVILDHELKREYQQFLQERNRGKSESDGRPDRTPEEIHRWAVEHELPEHDGHVQFPDARIEYEDRDGHLRTLDIEVETLHYRGAHAGLQGVLWIQPSQRRHRARGRLPGRRNGRRRTRSRLRNHHHRQHGEARWARPRSASR